MMSKQARADRLEQIRFWMDVIFEVGRRGRKRDEHAELSLGRSFLRT
jgi:hypothetical protein